jgi:hypothetical protein
VAAPQREAPTLALGSDFAIADFDGDSRPDLATIDDIEQVNSSGARYWITFHLSAGAGQALGVAGPLGGLQILPHDVNGDHVPDLIVTAKWKHQTVAIFINDGFGGFTPVDPAGYPIELQACDTELRPAAAPWEHSAVLLGTKSLAGEPVEGRGSYSPRQLPGPPFSLISRVHGPSFRSPFSGRAPPAFRSAS